MDTVYNKLFSTPFDVNSKKGNLKVANGTIKMIRKFCRNFVLLQPIFLTYFSLRLTAGKGKYVKYFPKIKNMYNWLFCSLLLIIH